MHHAVPSVAGGIPSQWSGERGRDEHVRPRLLHRPDGRREERVRMASEPLGDQPSTLLRRALLDPRPQLVVHSRGGGPSLLVHHGADPGFHDQARSFGVAEELHVVTSRAQPCRCGDERMEVAAGTGEEGDAQHAHGANLSPSRRQSPESGCGSTRRRSRCSRLRSCASFGARRRDRSSADGELQRQASRSVIGSRTLCASASCFPLGPQALGAASFGCRT